LPVLASHTWVELFVVTGGKGPAEPVPETLRGHEQQHVEWLTVSAGRDPVHGDGDARGIDVAKRGAKVLRLDAPDLVDHLLGEAVALGEHFAYDPDNVVGVAVVFGEDGVVGTSMRPGRRSVASASVKVRMPVRIDMAMPVSIHR
jgi:hypothetical protein